MARRLCQEAAEIPRVPWYSLASDLTFLKLLNSSVTHAVSCCGLKRSPVALGTLITATCLMVTFAMKKSVPSFLGYVRLNSWILGCYLGYNPLLL